MLRQKLSQKLLQKLSPQQIQLMKLLLVPTVSLDQRIKEEIEANPALEEGDEVESEDSEADDNDDIETLDETDELQIDDDIDVTDYLNDDEIASYKLSNNDYSDDDEPKSVPIRVINTFNEYLEQQLGVIKLDDRRYDIALQIIGSIDDDGYLRRSMDAIIDDLMFSQNITTTKEEIQELLEMIYKFDPPGVGAKDLQECLLLQLERKDENDKNVKLGLKILKDHFEPFVRKHFTKLEKKMSLSAEELKEVMDEILKLNPKPGSGFLESPRSELYVVPDYIITNREGELELKLNSMNAPELRVSRSYQDILQSYSESKKKDKKQKETIMFIKQKIDGAKWFIDAIKQRQETLLLTMQAIMNYQYDYFITGDEIKMKPMILKDIAEITNLDISTISRVTNNKYAQTEFGTFLLKSFFSESIETESGEEVSTREVKKILTKLIDDENKQKPLSDEKLMKLLKEKGYSIARRTVAKYREQLNIPVARLRKEL